MMEKFSASANLIGYFQLVNCPESLKSLQPIVAKCVNLERSDLFPSDDHTDDWSSSIRSPSDIRWSDGYKDLDKDILRAFTSFLSSADAKNIRPPLTNLVVFKKNSVTVRGHRFANFSASPNNSLVCLELPGRSIISYPGEIQEMFSVYFCVDGKSDEVRERTFLAVHRYIPLSLAHALKSPFRRFEDFGASIWSREQENTPIIVEAGITPMLPAMRRSWDNDTYVFKPTQKVK